MAKALGTPTFDDASDPIEVIKAPAETKVAPVGMPKSGYWRIMLEDSDIIPPGGQFFGINGKGYKLRPGVEADVPAGIIDILDAAVGSSPVVDPDTLKVIGYRDRLRFPYRVIRRPQQAGNAS
jgi:hypothetical protein